MHASLFDQYQDQTSLIHRLDPRAKVVVTLLFCISTVLLPDGAWAAFLLAWAFLLYGHFTARVPYPYTLKRSLIAVPFALAAVSVVFILPGTTVTTLKLGSWQLVVTDSGLVRFASIVLRSWLSVQMAILLTATTRFPDIIHALRHLYVPHMLVAVIAFMYRYAFVLSDEVLRLLRARESRRARLDDRKAGGSIPWRARVAGNMAGQLFLRSYERSDRVYNAMLARGYRGEFLTIHPHEIDTTDWVFGIISVSVMLLTQLIGRWGMIL